MEMATKQGTQLTPVTGLSTRFMVEYDDGTASVHPTWDEAFTAGQFETDDVAA